jgi:hypothetical protein
MESILKRLNPRLLSLACILFGKKVNTVPEITVYRLGKFIIALDQTEEISSSDCKKYKAHMPSAELDFSLTDEVCLKCGQNLSVFETNGNGVCFDCTNLIVQ